MKDLINEYSLEFNVELEKYLNNYNKKVPLMFESIEYSILNGGKRVRPILAYLGAEFIGKDRHYSDNIALGIEMIHSYSLVHDDLPCMDNDDLRRGKLTTHKKFGEAMGVLAGDGLLTLAFETMLSLSNSIYDCKAIAYIAKMAGINGMVGGQCIDINNTTDQHNSIENITLLNKLKTSCLIKAALVGSAIKCGADDSQINDLEVYGDCVGQIFQLVDDLLDIHSTSEEMGKTVGKDKAQDKNTYVNILGENQTFKEINRLEKLSIDTLHKYGNKANNLIEFAKFLTRRIK